MWLNSEAWWDYNYHTYLGITKLFYLNLSWAHICSQNHSHDLVSWITEHITLKRFGHVFANHISCGTPEYWKFTIINPIGDKEIPNVNVMYNFSALGHPIII